MTEGARLRFGTLVTAGTGTVLVEVDGVQVTAILPPGVTLPGTVVCMVQDGRRLVALGTSA